MISAIILTWNSARYIERCLRSLIEDAHKTDLPLEIFVVDGGSTDETLEILSELAQEIPEIQIIELGRNLGTTISRNTAFKKARGNYLLILDSDTEVIPGALEKMLRALKEYPRVGIACPRLFYPNGSVQISCKRFPTILIKICKIAPLSWLQRVGEKAELYPSEIYSKNFKNIVRVDHSISACWLIRREAVKTIGLLDEKIFYAPEDVDYCLRMWLAGWEVLYVPSAEVIHYTQRRSHKNLYMAWIHAKGLFHYFRQYGYWLSRKKIYKQICKIAKDKGITPPLGLSGSNPILSAKFFL